MSRDAVGESGIPGNAGIEQARVLIKIISTFVIAKLPGIAATLAALEPASRPPPLRSLPAHRRRATRAKGGQPGVPYRTAILQLPRINCLCQCFQYASFAETGSRGVFGENAILYASGIS